MSFFGKKIHQLENRGSEESINLVKATSDKAADIIKELSGKETSKGKKLVDNLIVFTNAAGGAGASTIAHNVAYTATTKGIKTILVDLNIMCPVQQMYIGVKQELEKPDLVSYLLGRNNLSDSIDTSHVVNLLYANNRTLQDQINCNSKIVIENFNAMLTKLRQFYDLVIVDCPMKIEEMLENVMLYSCDTIYMVWDEGIGSIANTEKLRRNMALSGIDSFVKLKIILNKRTSIHFTEYPITKLNLELVEVLPFDIDILDNSLKGRIFCEKGASASKNAIIFAQKIGTLTDKILKIGGYIG